MPPFGWMPISGLVTQSFNLPYTVGDLLNLGLIRAWSNLPPGWKISANNHDSVLAQVPEDTDEMHIVKFFKHYFEIPLSVNDYTFTIPMDIKTGINWGEMHDIKL